MYIYMYVDLFVHSWPGSMCELNINKNIAACTAVAAPWQALSGHA